MNHFDQLRRRWEWSYPPAVFGAELPTEAPPKVVPFAPPVDRPVEIRRALASWWYTVAYHRGTWTQAAKNAFLQLSELRIQYFGPAGWDAQPGWLDLAQRAEIALNQSGVDKETIQGWKGVVDRWIAAWDQEFDQASYSRRVEIGQAWQNAYKEGLKAKVKNEIDQRLPDSPFEFGAGAALMLTGVVVIGGALLFPDIAADQAKDTAGRYRRLVGR